MGRDAAVQAVRAAAQGVSDGAAVVAVLGVSGSRPASLADISLGTNLASTVSASPSPLVAGNASDRNNALVLVHSSLADDPDATPAAELAVSLAGIVVLNARAVDFERPAAAGIAPFMSALGRCLELRVATAAPAIPSRRLLLVAVRDFEPADMESSDLEAAVTEQLHRAYSSLDQLPAAYTATELEDLFDIQFLFLPSETLCGPQFRYVGSALSRAVIEAGRNGYIDAGLSATSMDQAANRVWGALDPQSAVAASRELPDERELAATFACSEIMKAVFEKYASTTRQWKSTVESGRIILDFGKECTNLIESTLTKYGTDAATYRSSKAFPRKRDELRSLCLAEAYVLYARQILKLREVAYQVFRGNLARIRINDKVEKNVNAAVKNAETYFVQKAESLRSTLSSWRFDNERHELVNHMREDATERLQLARLQGNYVPPIRAPVAVAFHTLLTAPFGQDSNAAQATMPDQLHPKVDKDKAKKAALSRARPHQTPGFKFKVGSGDELDVQGCVDTFSGIFVESGSESGK